MTKTIEEMQQEISAKAATDQAFRAELLKNPRATIESMFNIEMPAGMKVHAFELNPDDVMIALPRVEQADGELNDADLEAVAGGAAKPGQPIGGGFPGYPKPGVPGPGKPGSLFIGGGGQDFWAGFPKEKGKLC